MVFAPGCGSALGYSLNQRRLIPERRRLPKPAEPRPLPKLLEPGIRLERARSDWRRLLEPKPDPVDRLPDDRPGFLRAVPDAGDLKPPVVRSRACRLRTATGGA